MSTIYISKIFDKVFQETGDLGFLRSKADMLSWFNEGEAALVSLKPDAYVKTAIQRLEEGTKQTIAADGIIFQDALCNMGTDGSTPGKNIRIISKANMNRFAPLWHAETANAAVDVIVFDKRNPKIFYTSPPQPETNPGYLKYEYSATPPKIIVTDDNYNVTFTVGDEHEPALLNYILFRIYSEDTGQISDAVQRAEKYWSLFSGVNITNKENVESRNEPVLVEN